MKTLAPPSELPSISLGVWISIKSFYIQNSLNNWQTALYTLKIACLAGVLKSRILLSNLVYIFTLIELSSSFFTSSASFKVDLSTF